MNSGSKLEDTSTAVTEESIAAVMNGIAAFARSELAQTTQAGLERYWFFKWNQTASLETNIYNFHKLLSLYGGQCRRWEEMRNGSCCVVERVRDTYLMPKIREFAKMLISA